MCSIEKKLKQMVECSKKIEDDKIEDITDFICKNENFKHEFIQINKAFFQMDKPEEKFACAKKSVGVYLFYLKDGDIGNFKKVWQTYSQDKKTPKVNTNNSGKFIYTGKFFSDSLDKRLNQHILKNDKDMTSTYALKLKGFFDELDSDYEIECHYYYYRQEKGGVEDDLLLRIYESLIYNRVKPLLGSNR